MPRSPTLRSYVIAAMSPDDPSLRTDGATRSLCGELPTAAAPASSDSLRVDAAENSSIFLIDGLCPALTPAVHLPLEGATVGGVRIAHVIGEGGMGRVYEGRHERLGRTVAVKVMRPGLTTPEMRKQFIKEAAILAQLRHPGIAQVFEAGEHMMEGVPVPYFIMEYVTEARQVTAYADERMLTMRERLELFQRVCDAVAAAHAAKVEHRDLKPPNILVDRDGQPKVIDFGVARMKNADLTMTMLEATRVGGTPSHMSPEQACGHGIDVRTDVYSLGVVLYQLLAGRPPFEFGDQAFYVIARTVLEVDPPSLRSILPSVPHDLDVIASHCLQKEKTHRYANASELRDDIGRFLAGEPIVARPPTAWQAIRRFARRYRVITAATAGVLTAFVVAFIGIVLFALDARAQQLRTERVLALAVQLLPGGPADNRLSPLELLRQHRGVVQEEPDATARATLLHAIGESLLGIGEYNDAVMCARDAHALWRDVLGEESDSALRSLSLLTTSLLRTGDMQEAFAAASLLVAGCEQRYKVGHAKTIEAKLMLAQAMRGSGKREEAANVVEDAWRQSESANGPDHGVTLLALNARGVAAAHRQAWANAIKHHKQAYEMASARFGRGDLDALQYGHNLGVAYLRAAAARVRGSVGDEAKTQQQRGIQVLVDVCEQRQRTLGLSHADSIVTLQELAAAYLESAQANSAAAILAPCRDILDARATAGDETAQKALATLAAVEEPQQAEGHEADKGSGRSDQQLDVKP